MIPPRWRKVWRDLYSNKARSLLVVLSIAVGIFAIGMIVGTNILLGDDLREAYAAINPPHAILNTAFFTEDMVTAVRRENAVKDAEAIFDQTLRYKLAPDDDWSDIRIQARQDYEEFHLKIIESEAGAYPPPYRELLLEQGALAYMGVALGDTIIIETPGGRQREVTVAGTVRDLDEMAVQLSGTPVAYVTLDTVRWLGSQPAFNRLYIQVSGDNLNEDKIRAVANDVSDRMERSGVPTGFVAVYPVGSHPADQILDPLLLILGLLGSISLFLSGFLIINIVNGLLAQHTTQIGIMKAIGARTGQISLMYLVLVVVFGLLALLIAIPLGGLAAYALAQFLAGLMNFQLPGFYIPGQALTIQTALAILVPIAAAAYPIFRGSRITVREAISEYGLGRGQFGSSVIDRVVNWVTSSVLTLSRPLRISLRNTIRRKGRLLLTLLTLALGGAIFIAIISVYTSLLTTLDEALNYFAFDVAVTFARPYRVEEMQREALRVPGVTAADSWIQDTARMVHADGFEGENIFMIGLEADTELIDPILTEGRWLQADDTTGVVINSAVIEQEGEIGVGDPLVLKLNGQDTEWQVVGIVRTALTGPIIYANRPFMARELNVIGRSTVIQVNTDQPDAAYQRDLAKRLEAHFDSVGMQVTSSLATEELREQIVFTFNIIVVMMTVMAILIASVGGLGLMGTMSINVLERTREIGVMRAVGASDRSVVRIVLVEGVFIGLISWVLAFAVGYPAGQALSQLVGNELLQTPLTYDFSLAGAVGWLLGILLLATVASYLPARNASRLTVWETLAYE